jgi:putative membrane protein
MDFITHVVITAIALVLISKLLRGFEVDNLFTASFIALILGLLHAVMVPIAEQMGQLIGRIIAAMVLAYPAKIALLFFAMLIVNALVLKLAAAIGPGFRISDFKTAVLGALLLVLLNGLIGEAMEFTAAYLSN